MTQAIHRIILLILLLALSFSAACTRDPFPNVTLPVHPKAINPEVKYDSPVKGAKAVVYKIRMPFPAEELTDLYDTEMKKMGYARVPADDIFTFQWMNFNSRSGEWEKTTTPPARYTAAWIDHQKKTRIWLYVIYRYDSANAEWNVTPLVGVNLAKFSDSTEVK